MLPASPASPFTMSHALKAGRNGHVSAAGHGCMLARASVALLIVVVDADVEQRMLSTIELCIAVH